MGREEGGRGRCVSEGGGMYGRGCESVCEGLCESV